MTDWTAADLPSFAGRTVIVTGANSGLGLVTARELARVGAHVVLAVRNTAKGDDAAAGISGSVEVRKLDLSDLASVREFADAATEAAVLVNNAGIMAVPYELTKDGFESQIGTNHLGHFALTNLLLPKITERVVTVSSMFHRMGKIDLNDLNFQHRRYNAWLAYAQSKLANLLFTGELQQRLVTAGSPVRALAAHSAGRLSTAFLAMGDHLVATDADYGARQSLFAVSQDLPGNTYVGPRFGFYGPTQPVGRSRAARQIATATALWELSEQLTGTKFPL
jgi:NAD(P)-dependent dehydrogenase (short-subunit alcohol dehydrogenase family)